MRTRTSQMFAFNVLERLQEEEGFITTEKAIKALERHGYSRGSVRVILHRMVRNGYLKRISYGVYKINND